VVSRDFDVFAICFEVTRRARNHGISKSLRAAAIDGVEVKPTIDPGMGSGLSARDQKYRTASSAVR